MERPELVRKLYHEVRRLRTLDDHLVALQRDGVLPYFISARGEECAIVAAALALREHDWLFPSPRDYGACLVRGVEMVALYHHFLGTGEDPAHGRQRPNFFGFPRARIAGVAGSVGAHVPHAVGLAWAARVKGDPIAALCMFGDGATSAGEFHNGANFAGVFRAPVVLLCRNNGHAGGFPVERQCAVESLADKADAYGIRGKSVRADDAIRVYTTVSESLQDARNGAILLEVVTHGLEQDPFAALASEFVASHGAEARAAIDAACEREVQDAYARASAAPPPTRATLTTDVFAAPNLSGGQTCK